MKTGTQAIVHPESRYEIDTLICDICGLEATGRSPCRICKRDLCGTHQLDFHGIGYYPQEKVPTGIYCSECLVKRIQSF